MRELFPDDRTDEQIRADADRRFDGLRLVWAPDDSIDVDKKIDVIDWEEVAAGVRYILDRVAESQGINVNRN